MITKKKENKLESEIETKQSSNESVSFVLFSLPTENI